MQLDNATPVPVKAMIHAPPEGARTAIFTAKATFAFDESGRVELDRDAPFPIIDDDEPTELGLLPRDSLPRCDDAFEVVLLGNAHAPGGRPVPHMPVTLAVASERRQLAVFGDRVWQGTGADAQISAPQPFVTMPLTWQHAFGGTQQVEVDRDSPVDVSDPVNPEGKGFDHFAQSRLIGETLKSPEPYPLFSPVRELPNLEDPRTPIQRWDDQPLPACWAPSPLHSALVIERLRRARRARPDRPVTLGSPQFMHRAHPDWVIALPSPGARIEMDGLLPSGRASFELPGFGVDIDLRAGDAEQTLTLVPRMLVLLPERKRFYIVYRHYTTYEYDPMQSRGARVRITERWPAA